MVRQEGLFEELMFKHEGSEKACITEQCSKGNEVNCYEGTHKREKWLVWLKHRNRQEMRLKQKI